MEIIKSIYAVYTGKVDIVKRTNTSIYLSTGDHFEAKKFLMGLNLMKEIMYFLIDEGSVDDTISAGIMERRKIAQVKLNETEKLIEQYSTTMTVVTDSKLETIKVDDILDGVVSGWINGKVFLVSIDEFIFALRQSEDCCPRCSCTDYVCVDEDDLNIVECTACGHSYSL